MKRKYEKPQIEAVEIESASCLLAASGEKPEGGIGAGGSEGGGSLFGDGAANGASENMPTGKSLWDDAEDNGKDF